MKVKIGIVQSILKLLIACLYDFTMIKTEYSSTKVIGKGFAPKEWLMKAPLVKIAFALAIIVFVLLLGFLVVVLLNHFFPVATGIAWEQIQKFMSFLLDLVINARNAFQGN